MIFVAVLVVIDQVTKRLSVVYLKGKSPLVIIDGVFEFRYLQNTGAAWGIMSGGRTIFIILTLIIMLVIALIVWRIPIERKYIPFRIFTILLTAGAIGNLIDRIVYHYVNDFIYFSLIDFPIFNVADIYVTLSMLLLIILVLFVYKDEHDFSFIWPRKKNNEKK